MIDVSFSNKEWAMKSLTGHSQRFAITSSTLSEILLFNQNRTSSQMENKSHMMNQRSPHRRLPPVGRRSASELGQALNRLEKNGSKMIHSQFGVFLGLDLAFLLDCWEIFGIFWDRIQFVCFETYPQVILSTAIKSSNSSLEKIGHIWLQD